jgi:pimeloyl-ACP methyl ester carboxylesterase
MLVMRPVVVAQSGNGEAKGRGQNRGLAKRFFAASAPVANRSASALRAQSRVSQRGGQAAMRIWAVVPRSVAAGSPDAVRPAPDYGRHHVGNQRLQRGTLLIPMGAAAEWLEVLLSRYDPRVFRPRRRQIRVRLMASEEAWDVVLGDGEAVTTPAGGDPDAVITGVPDVWRRIAAGLRGNIDAYLAGELGVRRNLHVGVGFLAATSGATHTGRIRFRSVSTGRVRLSVLEAGDGPPVLALHGLGGTKGSFLPTVNALSNRYRVIAFDLPGFGDSDKPIGAAYDARFFADVCIDLLDALELDRVHLVGNSLGGRIALEVALRRPERVNRLTLLAPSLAWRRARQWVPLLRLTRPEFGLVQLAPRAVVDGIVRRLIPGANDGWMAAGVDEFLRAYLTSAGRAAFYAAARHIYLEEPDGRDGFWPRLATLQANALFIWGRRDRLVPIAFERHVAEVLPQARHLELDCGHVPQVERAAETHDAISAFLSEAATSTCALVARTELETNAAKLGRQPGRDRAQPATS